MLCAFVCACRFVVYCSYQVISFLRAEEHMGEKKSNDERNRRASKHLLAHQPLEDQHYCSRFDVWQCLGNKIDLSDTRYSYSCLSLS